MTGARRGAFGASGIMAIEPYELGKKQRPWGKHGRGARRQGVSNGQLQDTIFSVPRQ